MPRGTEPERNLLVKPQFSIKKINIPHAPDVALDCRPDGPEGHLVANATLITFAHCALEVAPDELMAHYVNYRKQVVRNPDETCCLRRGFDCSPLRGCCRTV
jgi:hypothetical protein